MRRDPESRVRRGDDGYTLTEILVVLAIIGLIAAVLTPGLVGQLGRARAKTGQMQVETLAAAVEVFRSDVGRYPTKGEGLNALLAEPGDAAGWTGPYIKSSKVMKDPWGHDIAYDATDDSRSFTVTSYGADGKGGGVGLDKDLQAPNGQ
jgi:general secretion pathway protein G